jgi:hypothetical protein
MKSEGWLPFPFIALVNSLLRLIGGCASAGECRSTEIQTTASAGSSAEPSLC